MIRHSKRNRGRQARLLSAALVGATLSGSALLAPAAIAADEPMEEVVVTGSYIAGTPEDAELPVDVISRNDLEEQGTPSLIEMVRNLGVTSGNLGETNQFQAGGQANEGVATINLRGLGGARTLVLLNGKRQVATETQGVDINAIPSIAIGRLEILKDGAAALYGSDAIAGVVNFITREDFEGFEMQANYQGIADSDGDWDIGAIYGFATDTFSVNFAAEYSQRDELPISERSWALRPFSENSQGGWSGIANPGNILVPGVGVVPDPQCELLGGFRDSIASCGFQFTAFDNLIEETEALKLFSQARFDINDTTTLHVEALWSEVDIPAWKTSPSYPPQSLFGNDRLVLDDHPGLVDLRAQNPAFPQTGAVIPITRARGVVGKGAEGEPEDGLRNTETLRFAASLDGTIGDSGIGYNVSAGWSKRDRELTGNDMFIERMGFALRGLGGPNCDRAAAFAAGTFGQGDCEYYNPFSNALQQSVVNGVVNPQYNPAVANSAEIFDWLIADTGSSTTNELLTLETIFNGQTGIELAGGNVGWAAGVQGRRETYKFRTVPIADRALNPCPWTDPLAITLGFTDTLDCTVQSGRLAFLAANDAQDNERWVVGAFAEVALPITEDIQVQLAVRYEDYEGPVGSTFDPKIAASWNVTDWFTIRGSASTTFRGPPQSFLGGTTTALQFIAAQNAFKAVDITGNPELNAESAFASNLGFVAQNESFYVSLDWWRFDFEDSFLTESAQQITDAYFGQACEDGGAGVGTASCDALRTHIFPLGTDAAGLQRIDTNWINAGDIDTSGLDLFAEYFFNGVADGTLSLGAEATYTFEYKSDDFLDINGALLAQGGDFVGFLNDGDPFTPKPEFQGNAFVKYERGIHRAQAILRYTDGYDDIRPAASTVSDLSKIDDFVTVDVFYNARLFDDRALLSLSVINLFDEDPPHASTDLNYDAFTHNPFGRMWKLGLKYNFGP